MNRHSYSGGSGVGVECLSFESPQALAAAVAARWLAELPRGQKQVAALSGGRIAREFCSAVASLVREEPAALDGVHFFWADERCVPPDDPESNFRLARELLFKPLAMPPDRIHRQRGEVPPAVAVAEANAQFLGWASRDAAGLPVLDWVFLGMGEDGHVASLFPGASEAVIEVPGPYLAVTGPKPPPSRITLSYGVIAAAREVWVLASGAGKEQALAESLAGGETPLGRILRSRARTRVFTDIRRDPDP